MKKLLRMFFVADLPIATAYPIRMGIFYYAAAFSFLIAAYFVIADTVKNPNLAKEIFIKLFIAIILVGLVFFIVTFLYSKVVSKDYEKIVNFADTLSKGNLSEERINLSILADADLIKIKEALERLRNSLVISRELLKKRASKNK